MRLASGAFESHVGATGAGYALLGGLALTRHTPDAVTGGDGPVVYVRDVETGRFWSAGWRPAGQGADRYAFRSGPGYAAFERHDGPIETRLEIGVPPGASVGTGAEVRRLTLTNHGERPARLEVTTYAEAALNTPDADRGHPAFSKLFVQTAYVSDLRALVAERRLRSPDDAPLAVAHTLVPDDGTGAEPTFETDRMRFVGRGRTTASPTAMAGHAPLSGTVGAVLDPVLSLRRAVTIAPGATAGFTLCLAAGPTRDAALGALYPWLSGRRAHAAIVASRAAAGEGQGPGGEEATTTFEPEPPARFRPAADVWTADAAPRGEPALAFDNGYGGFADEGRTYRIRVFPGGRNADGEPIPAHLPPMPWSNVVANERVGFLVTERGAAHTWSANARENRLTPWSNDPVSDPHGESLWLRDEDAGAFWSLTPGPAGLPAWHAVTHGWGFSRFEAEYGGLAQSTTFSAAPDAPAVFAEIELRNTSGRPRRLTLFAFRPLVLGAEPHRTAGRVETWADGGVLLARNPERGEFAHLVAFSALAGAGEPSFTTDRTAFVGRCGCAERPRALTHGAALDGATGTLESACFAHALTFTIAPGETWRGAAILGEADTAESALKIAAHYGSEAHRTQALAGSKAFWEGVCGAVRVETPIPEIDLVANGWLAYQNLSSRMLGRTAFYQSSGAFGFRDQLQDSSAFTATHPEIARRQLLLHAAHQFEAGDVLHWWHPPADKGMRTRFADDLLWLPYFAAHYVATTGDAAVLDEPAGFVAARALEDGEDEAFVHPTRSGRTASLYEHACLALDRSLTRGAHGLPLMGVGDWNDGMNRVGREGRGESVWMGFFIYSILGRFLPFVNARGDAERAARYRAYRADLHTALNAGGGTAGGGTGGSGDGAAADGGWDGAWYRRAYYDNGAPLGAAESDECRIDALAQAWAVLSGAAPPDRAKAALDAMEEHLVDEAAGIIRLLTPAFDKTPNDPGYIKGYLPGVRENGGQYTHAAAWAVRALAENGRRDRAARLLAMLSPVSHARTREEADVYKTEPYVVAADVYGVAPHVGRGGWTWYTGSAGWLQRVAIESILGITLRGGTHVRVAPCVPDEWAGFRVTLRLPGERTVTVTVDNPDGCAARVVSAHARTAGPGSTGASVEDGIARIALPTSGPVDVRIVLGA